jgi:anti-anti-sigma regulatory factor
MLRISRFDTGDSGQTIKLEGKLLAPWTSVVRAACLNAAHIRGLPSLDLSGLTYVDTAGAKLLAELVATGVGLVHCSPFVATLLHREVSL